MYIDITNVNKQFTHKGKLFTALENVNLSIDRGEFICLLGPSGCGKSTLLNAIAGFDPPSSGTVVIDGCEVRKPSSRNVTIFQNYGLLPWRNVLRNVELALESRKDITRAKREEIARCPAACSSGWPLPELSQPIPRLSSWTNLSELWTPLPE